MDCPNFSQKLFTDPAYDNVVEGLPMCDLNDKVCLKEIGYECEEYDKIKEEDK